MRSLLHSALPTEPRLIERPAVKPVLSCTPFQRLGALAGWLVACAALALFCGPALAADTTPAQQLERFNAQAKVPGRADQGRAFFTTRQGGEWSCASCHGNPPTAEGKHANTGKTIKPMAPASNPLAFTDTAKVDKWFKRNCNDVLSRECSADEKANVLAYLLSLKP